VNGPGGARSTAAAGLTVAVTGPTGQIGQAVLRALDRAREIKQVVGMARRPFDPAEHGYRKVSYRQGDVLDREAVADLVAGVDVVVHLAFIIMGDARKSRVVNIEGSRNVFDAVAAAGPRRLVYASSIAAYGFHRSNPQPLTEEVPARGSSSLYYSAQKAEVETLLKETLDDSRTAVYVLRPCLVGGPDAPLLLESLPYKQLALRLPRPLVSALGHVPVLKPVLPDPGVSFQLVHQDDLALAVRAAVLGRGRPGAYNLAGPGQITLTQLARELGWRSIPAPRLALDALSATLPRLRFLPYQAQWIAALRTPVIVDAAEARRELRWRPRHDALSTLRETIAAA
jgi:UDP-glucose 4-epimerase